MIALAASTPCIANAQDGDVTALVTANPLALTLELQREEVRAGSAVAASMQIANVGAGSIHSIEVVVLFDETSITARGGSSESLHSLHGGAARTLTRVLQAQQPGSYVIVARASGTTSVGVPIEVESNAVVLTVR